MLRPARGEGERPEKETTTSKAKGPLFITATLVAMYPVCLAQMLISDDVAYAQPLQSELQQTAQRTLPQSLPRTNQGLLLQPSQALLPSASNIQYLESTLSSYKAQLQTLKNTQPLDPTNTPQINQKIQELQTKINTLETQIQKVKDNYRLYGVYKTAYVSAVTTYNEAIQQEATTKAQLLQASTNKDVAYAQLQTQQERADHALQVLNATNQDITQLQRDLATAEDNFQSASTTLQNANAVKEDKELVKTYAQATFNEASLNLTAAGSQLTLSQTNKQTAQQQLTTAEQQKNQAQSNYDNNLIADPSWIRPTIQVPHTTLVPHTTQVANTTTRLVSTGLTATTYNRNGYNSAPPIPGANEAPLSTQTVPNVNFDWGSGNILNSGRSEDVIVKFTGYISPPTSGYYQFYAPADDGTLLYVDNQLIINDWYDKGGGGSLSYSVYLTAGQSVPITLYFYENGGGANVWLYTYNQNTGFEIVPASWFGSSYVTETTYTTVTTYEQVTTYTTEPDPNATAPRIHDPLLAAALQTANQNLETAQANYNTALEQEQIAQAEYTAAQTNNATAEADLQTATTNYTNAVNAASSAQTTYNEALSAQQVATTNLENASTDKTTAQSNYDLESTNLQTAQATYNTATSNHTTADQNYTTANANLQTATTAQTNANEDLTGSETILTTSYQSASESSDPNNFNFTSVNSLLTTPAPVPEPIPTPTPTPAPEPEPAPAEELPAEVTADNLTQIDFAAVDTSTITPEQADQLVEAALEIFATAEEGSPEYEAALDALYLAATEDDIEISQEIAAVPVLGAAVAGIADAINFLGNAGADLSPKVREESQKIVVSALVVGQVAQIGSAAAMSSASSSFRRN